MVARDVEELKGALPLALCGVIRIRLPAFDLECGYTIKSYNSSLRQSNPTGMYQPYE
jgi:hypothetical protein